MFPLLKNTVGCFKYNHRARFLKLLTTVCWHPNQRSLLEKNVVYNFSRIHFFRLMLFFYFLLFNRIALETMVNCPICLKGECERLFLMAKHHEYPFPTYSFTCPQYMFFSELFPLRDSKQHSRHHQLAHAVI